MKHIPVHRYKRVVCQTDGLHESYLLFFPPFFLSFSEAGEGGASRSFLMTKSPSKCTRLEKHSIAAKSVELTMVVILYWSQPELLKHLSHIPMPVANNMRCLVAFGSSKNRKHHQKLSADDRESVVDRSKRFGSAASRE